MNAQAVYPQSEATVSKESVAAVSKPRTAARLLFVDNLRIFLTILVILHHLMNIYAGSGGWIYHEGREDMLTALLGKWFTTVNQSYFMGLFMLISAYFVPGSCDRKGVWRFLKDRLVRLGIPLVIYSWVLRPLLVYAGLSSAGEVEAAFPQWYVSRYFAEYGFFGSGPLWFISALLLFSMVYAIVRWLTASRPICPSVETHFPSNATIAFFALLVAIFSFLVRLWYPSDKVFLPLSFQFADFPQYIALFIAGLVAYRRNWLVRVSQKTGRIWMVVAAVMVLLWPPIVILLGAFDNLELFLGGWHWQSLLSATWQSLLGVSMCVTMVHLFLRRLDYQGALGGFLSRNAYTAYLIHEPVITFAAVAAMGAMLYPLLKFGLMALLSVPLIFVLSSLIRKLPFTGRIL
jgi:glucans biosynthesis protein C